MHGERSAELVLIDSRVTLELGVYSSDKSWSSLSFSSLSTDEKTGEIEQKDDIENQLSEVAAKAEESPPSSPLVTQKATQSQDGLNQDVSDETQQTVSQPNPGRTHPNRGRPPKTTLLSAQKKTPLKKDERTQLFQDDPSDVDYTPSKCPLMASLMI